MEIEHFENKYTIAYTVQSHWVDFDVYEIVAHSESEPGKFDVPEYQEIDAVSNLPGVKDLSKAEKFWHGSIKWDGCSNWDFNTESCMAHFCGKEDAMMIGKLMGRMYEITAEKLPTYDKSVAE